MEAVGILILVVPIVIWWKYTSWLQAGVQPRTMTSQLTPDELRDLFLGTVCTSGWKVVDDGNPMVAQSSLVTGMRQQLALQVTPSEDGTYEARIFPVRLVVKTLSRIPTKAHTLRMRMNRFVAAVRSADPLSGASVAESSPEPEVILPVASAAVGPVSARLGGPTEGWYPDPTDARQLRWWDGSAWTTHQSPW